MEWRMKMKTYCRHSLVVQVQDTSAVRAELMHSTVQHEAALVDAEGGDAGVDDLALHVHLHQRGGSQLVVHHPVGVDEEVFLLLADANLCRK